MGTKLTYPKLPSGGKTFNLIEKIHLQVGYRPWTYSSGSGTHILFSEDLTAQQEAEVDAIVGDGSAAKGELIFAITNNRVIVKDIYVYREEIEADIGFNIAITYRSSGVKGSAYDEIVVQATDPTYTMEKIMTNPEKNSLVGAIEDLIRIE